MRMEMWKKCSDRQFVRALLWGLRHWLNVVDQASHYMDHAQLVHALHKWWGLPDYLDDRLDAEGVLYQVAKETTRLLESWREAMSAARDLEALLKRYLDLTQPCPDSTIRHPWDLRGVE